MIAIGLAALAMASVQHLRALKQMRGHYPALPLSISGITAALIGSLGVFALLDAILRHW